MAISSSLAIALLLSADTGKASKVIDKFASSTANKLATLSQNSRDIIKNGFADIELGKQWVAPVVSLVESAAKFETGMLAIRKQLKNDTPEAVKVMSGEVFKLSKELGMAADQTQELVASGLKMGVAEDKIMKFTLVAGKMAKAFDLPAEKLASDMAGIGLLFDIPPLARESLRVLC